MFHLFLDISAANLQPGEGNTRSNTIFIQAELQGRRAHPPTSTCRPEEAQSPRSPEQPEGLYNIIAVIAQ